jgi:hypothetical protein
MRYEIKATLVICDECGSEQLINGIGYHLVAQKLREKGWEGEDDERDFCSSDCEQNALAFEWKMKPWGINKAATTTESEADDAQ